MFLLTWIDVKSLLSKNYDVTHGLLQTNCALVAFRMRFLWTSVSLHCNGKLNTLNALALFCETNLPYFCSFSRYLRIKSYFQCIFLLFKILVCFFCCGFLDMCSWFFKKLIFCI